LGAGAKLSDPGKLVFKNKFDKIEKLVDETMS
jgi:hypothetical protein